MKQCVVLTYFENEGIKMYGDAAINASQAGG